MLIRTDGSWITRHHIGHVRRLAVAALGDHAEQRIALGEYTGEPAVLDHDECADMFLTHETRGIADGHIRRRSDYFLVFDDGLDQPVRHVGLPVCRLSFWF